MSAEAIAALARVLANPTCAQVLDALLAERTLTVGALAGEVGAARSTVSEAVAALAGAGLVTRGRRGRTTQVRLAGPAVAEALEALGRLADPPAPRGLRAVTRAEALRRGRTCYDHLAGGLGVRVADALVEGAVLDVAGPDGWSLGVDAPDRLARLGLDPAVVVAAERRPLVRPCLDWTERRPHLAGRLGAAICRLWLHDGLARRLPGGRAVVVTPAGERWIECARSLTSGVSRRAVARLSQSTP